MNAHSSKQTIDAENPRSPSGFEGKETILEPVLKVTESALSVYVIKPFDTTFTASAICLTFLRSSEAALCPVETQRPKVPFFWRTLLHIKKAIAKLLPTCLEETQIFLR